MINNVINNLVDELSMLCNLKSEEIRNVANRNQCFYLAQEDLFTVKFSEGVNIDVILSESTYSVRYEEEIDDEHANQIILDEIDDKTYKLSKSIKEELNKGPELVIETNTQVENIEEEANIKEVILEEENINVSNGVKKNVSNKVSKEYGTERNFEKLKKISPSDTFNSYASAEVINVSANSNFSGEHYVSGFSEDKTNIYNNKDLLENTQKEMTTEVKTDIREKESEAAWKFNYDHSERISNVFERAGNMIVDTAKQEFVGGNEYAAAGQQKLKDMTLDTDMIVNQINMLHQANMITQQEKEVGNVTYAIGTLPPEKLKNFDINSLSDSNVEDLRKSLTNIGFEKNDIKTIIENREEIYQNLNAWSDLMVMEKTGKLQLNEDEKTLLHSTNFLKGGATTNETYQSIITKALKTTEYDFLTQQGLNTLTDKDFNSAVEKINDITLSRAVKEFYKDEVIEKPFERNLLLKFAKDNNKNGLFNFEELEKLSTKDLKEIVSKKLCLKDEKTLFLLKELKKKNKCASLLSKTRSAKTIGAKLWKSLKNSTDDGVKDGTFTNDGIEKMQRYFGRGTIGNRMAGYAFKGVKFGASLPGRAIALAQGKPCGIGVVTLENGTKKIVFNKYDSISNQLLRKATERKQVIAKQVQKQKTVIAKTKVGKKIATKKAKKAAKKAAKNTGKKIAGNVFKKALEKVADFVSVVGQIKFYAIIIIAALALYVVQFGFSAHLMLETVYSTGLMCYNVMNKMILIDMEPAEKLVKEAKIDEQNRYVDALDIALSPIGSKGLGSPEVYGGYQIKYYGLHNTTTEIINNKTIGDLIGGTKTYRIKEDCYEYEGDNTTEGYHIYYIDSEGKLIGAQSTNIKDVISMSAVLLGNIIDTTSDDTDIYKLSKIFYERMNPDIHIVESEIYACDTGCHTLPDDKGNYYCDDSAFYEKVTELKNAQVKFIQEPAEQTANGCKYEVKCNGHEVDFQDPDGIYDSGDEIDAHMEYCSTLTGYVRDGIPSGCDNSETSTFCEGHSAVKICPGHKDVNVYVTLLTRKDVEKYPDGIIKYLVPKKYSDTGTVEEYDEFETDINVDYRDSAGSIEKFYENGGWTDLEIERLNNFAEEVNWYDEYGVEVGDGIISFN